MRKLGGGYRNWFRLLQCARTRMATFVDFSELANIKVRVNGRCGDVRMSKKFLDYSQIAVMFKQVGCETMSEKMRVNALAESSQRRKLGHKLPDRLIG
jgi:hypothetical protein